MALSPTGEVTIRPFVPEDLPQVTALERSVYGSGSYSTYFFRQLYDLFPTLVWVAEDDRQVVGHVCGAVSVGGETGWILNAAVLAHYRRRGIARRMLEHCITNLREAGVRRIRVTSEPDNAAAIKLYDKLGFHQIDIIENYYGEGMDRVILESITKG